MDRCKELIKDLVGKQHVYLVRRGNDAIKQALKLSGRTRVMIQDQGGWLTYTQFIKKLRLSYSFLKTEHGLLDAKTIDKSINRIFDKNIERTEAAMNSAVLLVNSMPGYAFVQDMMSLTRACQQKGILIINDASGSIGTEEAKQGNIILGSFGRDKPLDIGMGGFIACDTAMDVQEAELDLVRLEKALLILKEKLSFWHQLKSRILKDLDEFDIIKGEGINVIIRFREQAEKNKIIEYCKRNNFIYTLCPRYIRVLEDAICIEVKRWYYA